MKLIVWITAGCFIDVDIDVVPALSKWFKIHWYIWGNMSHGDKKRIKEVALSDNLKIDYVKIKSKWYSPFVYFEYKKKLRQIIKKNELLYVDNVGGLCFYQALHNICDIEKTILAIHNVKTPAGARFERLARFNTLYAVKHFKNIQTFSHNQHEYLNSLVSGKNVLEAPLILKNYGLPSRERTDKTFNFLTFGHIRGYKRIDLLIEAAQELAGRTDKKFKVTIVGNCKNWEKYQLMIKRKELFDVKIGFVENDDIPNYFNEADFFVLPYQDLAQSGAITVAFQYNVPVITSDIIQFKEFNNDPSCGFMFKSCDSHDLSVVMERALNLSPQEIQKMKEVQKKFVEKVFSAKFILNKYVDYLNKL